MPKGLTESPIHPVGDRRGAKAAGDTRQRGGHMEGGLISSPTQPPGDPSKRGTKGKRGRVS